MKQPNLKTILKTWIIVQNVLITFAFQIFNLFLKITGKFLSLAMYKKNYKVSTYKQKCDVCWLLVVADRNFPSSFFDPDVETKNYIYNCDFEKAFCMWDWYGDYFEIQKNN